MAARLRLLRYGLPIMLSTQTRPSGGFRLSKLSRYALCLAIIAAATLVRRLLNPVLGTELPYIVLYFAIMLIAWLGGLGPAFLGTILGVLTANYVFMPPQHAWAIFVGMHNTLTTALFVFIGIATGAMSERYRRALAQSEDAFRLSQNRQLELEHIYSSAPVGLAFVDEDLRYLRVNEALASFNGVPAAKHTGKHITEVLPPPLAQTLIPLLQQVVATRMPLIGIELQGPIAPGSEHLRYVRASFYPVQLGDLKGIHAVVEDITTEKKAQDELKIVEEQLRHAVKMEAIGRLAGGVAHDFNNLLMVISSYTELLLDQLGSQPASAKKLRAIAGATSRAAQLTKQLLAFSRKQFMQPQIVDLDSLISNLEHLLRRLLTEDIDLILELNSERKKVKIDPSQFEQVLMNMAVNSRDAMPKGGRLVIHTIPQKLDEDISHAEFTLPAGEYVEISVTDSGSGMSPEVQSRIFDPFFTTKEPGQGTGLGLAMAYGIIKQSGGYIEVSSSSGQGTTFHIWIATTAEPNDHSIPESASSSHGRGTILLVEDETILRQAISESLSALGYVVIEAADGAQALEIVERKSNNIDVVVSDAVMPRMGGVDLVQKLRATYPAIKVVLMSGYAHAHSTVAEPDSDVVFLQKPFTHAELAKVIRRLLSNSLPA